MSRFLIRFLYLVLVMLPLALPVSAADEDDLMGLDEEVAEVDLLSEEDDGSAELVSDEDLMADEELMSEGDAESDDLMAEEELLASAEDDLLGDDTGSDEDIGLGLGSDSGSGDEIFPAAYEHIDDMKVFDPARYRERRGDFGYYKTGSPVKNSFRVNENNEESTDETIGILFFIVALPAQLYMNFYGWWQ